MSSVEAAMGTYLEHYGMCKNRDGYPDMSMRVIFYFLAFQMLHTHNVEYWDIAMYVVSMCMYCYHRVDINPPCFIINSVVQIYMYDQWLSDLNLMHTHKHTYM